MRIASRRWIGRWALTATLVALLLGPALGPVSAAVPSLPIADDGLFVTNLTAPVLAPGASGSVTFDVGNPLADAMAQTMVIVSVYAFNAYPGNSSGQVPADAPTFAGAGGPYLGPSAAPFSASALVAVRSLGLLAPHAQIPVSLPISSGGSTPSGDYALRVILSFIGSNGTDYLLASRGYFSSALWAQATDGPNGTPTLKLGTLNVSGVLPETAVLVRSNPFPWILYPLLAGALVLAAAGGYYAFRGPGSRSGARRPDEPIQAPRALGKRRINDGD